MSEDPDRIRREIEVTRGELSSDVDAVTNKVKPRRLAGDRLDRARGAVAGVKDRVMGTAHHAGEVGSEKTSAATHRVSAAASSARDQAASGSQRMRAQTEGSPLAAGLIVFGVGLLASSLLPRSQPEQRVAGQAKRTAMQHSAGVKEQARDSAHQVQNNLRQPAQQAMESVKTKTTQSASTVKDQTGAAAQDLQGQAREAGKTMKPH